MDHGKKDSTDIINEKNCAALHGGDVYRNRVRLDFSVNLNPFPMPASVKEAMLEGIGEIHQYPDHTQQKLREGIAAFEGVSADDIICGNGASELLMAAVHAVKPKKALITAPCYAGYAVALEAADAQIVEYCLDEKNGFALGEGILGKITSETDMVFIADPNNPNGRLIDQRIKDAIACRCKECGAVLVIDECFYPLTASGIRQRGLTDDALHLRAFTKTFAIPGVRLGYMISRDKDMLAGIKKHLPEWNVSRIAERTGEAAAEVLAETDYLERSAELIAEERDFLKTELEKLGIKVYPSDTNYLLIKSSAGLYGRLLEEGILIRRCANFSGLDDTYFRIAVRPHADNVKLAETLGRILRLCNAEQTCRS